MRQETWTRLKTPFFARDTHVVAKSLLGKVLVRRWRGQTLAGRITEVEAYVGEDDLACHAAKGRTPRTDVMYGPPGHAYVYLIYGMYHCLNVVTEQADFPAAVLIRAIEPLTGTDAMRRLRAVKDDRNLTNGPGKLTQALHIDDALKGENLLTSERLFLADDGHRYSARQIDATPRIGIDYAAHCAAYLWRYVVKSTAQRPE